jgi:hypothetical protein
MPKDPYRGSDPGPMHEMLGARTGGRVRNDTAGLITRATSKVAA